MKIRLCAGGSAGAADLERAQPAAAGSSSATAPSSADGPLIRKMIQELALDQRFELRQLLGPRLSLARLDDDHVRQLGGVAVGLVALDAAEVRQLALAVGAPADAGEAAGGERLAEHVAVPQELMAPTVKGAVELQCRGALQLGVAFEPVVRRPHPVEVRRGQPDSAVAPEHPPGLAQETDREVDPQVLDEVLGEDGLDVGELQPLGDRKS